MVEWGAVRLLEMRDGKDPHPGWPVGEIYREHGAGHHFSWQHSSESWNKTLTMLVASLLGYRWDNLKAFLHPAWCCPCTLPSVCCLTISAAAAGTGLQVQEKKRLSDGDVL